MHFASYYRWLVYQHLFPLPRHDAALLDIGCDDGGFIEQLSVRKSVAIDRAMSSLRKVQGRFSVCADGTQLPFRDAEFDHVLLSDVIEHVEDDQMLLSTAIRQIKPQGTLWLSTTASKFKLFPRFITGRAERSWGHVRKGYTPEQLTSQLTDHFDYQIVIWPERAFRSCYILLWICSKWLPDVARLITRLCFEVDVRWPAVASEHGHLYLRAVRHG